MATPANSTLTPFSYPWPPRLGPTTLLTYFWPAWMPPPSRQEAEDMVEGLLAYIDAQDGDPDFETSLGSIDATSHSDFMDQTEWSLGYGQEREGPDDNGVADGDGLDWVTKPTRKAA